MKQFLGYISTIFTLFFVTGCTFEEPVLNPFVQNGKTGDVTVLGRITSFTDYDVDSRGVKNQEEGKLTSMAIALFQVNGEGNGLNGSCEYFQYSPNQNELLFNIDRTEMGYVKDKRYAMYIFANMPGLAAFQEKFEDDESFTLDDILRDCVYNVEGIGIPANGFPMIGSLGDTFSTKIDQDGDWFIISPTKDGNGTGELVAPKVGKDAENLVSKTLLTIPMKALYSKINFTIQVRPDQSVQGNYAPQFTLKRCVVANIPRTVDFDKSSNSDSNVLSDDVSFTPTGNKEASGANTISFSFYLPERMLSPATTADKYAYPFMKSGLTPAEDEDGDGIRNEDEVYCQRHKSQLLGNDQKATHIVLEGQYRTHQNHYYDIEYTIHLGEDEYQDFNIKRNCEYNNYVTIKGIQSSDDMSGDDKEVSIDHRVNIKHTQPAIIALRRETLLDSHFEVRPLRVRKSNINVPGIDAVKVEVLNSGNAATKEGAWWIRLERSFGGLAPNSTPMFREDVDVNGDGVLGDVSIYIVDPAPEYIGNAAADPAYGKRKFFTYNLVSGRTANNSGEDRSGYSLWNSTVVYVPFNGDPNVSECVWIYIDENTVVGDDVRSGTVRLTYGSYNGTDFVPTTNSDYPPVDYVFSQRNLFDVKYGSNTYNMEYFEEYLYSFDAEDAFAKTDQAGMTWGLEEVQLSHEIKAVLVSKGTWGSVDEAIRDHLESISPYYDFYLPRDVKKGDNGDDYWTYASGKAYDGENGITHAYSGYKFNESIVNYVTGVDKIDVLTLNQRPKSAVEYCYNKNKRNEKGHVIWQGDKTNFKWYLPAVDEIEELVMSRYNSNTNYSYARFKEFQENNYWSCQPAYKNNYVSVNRTAGWRHGQYMIDNVDRARSTKVIYRDDSGDGPADPTNYYKQTSGMSGYFYYINSSYTDLLPEWLGGGLKNTTPLEVTGNEVFSGWNGKEQWNTDATKHRLSKPTYDAGALLRTEKARVRCIRVAP